MTREFTPAPSLAGCHLTDGTHCFFQGGLLCMTLSLFSVNPPPPFLLVTVPFVKSPLSLSHTWWGGIFLKPFLSYPNLSAPSVSHWDSY